MTSDYAAILADTALTSVMGDASKGEIQIVLPDALESSARTRLSPLGLVYRDDYIFIVRDAVRFPSGAIGTYIRIFTSSEKVGGVCIVPIYRGKVTFIRQFRHATRSWHVEIPRGFAEPGATPQQNAARELTEEVGVESKNWHSLGYIFADTGLIGSSIAVFAAEFDEHPTAFGDTGQAELLLADWDEIDNMVAAELIDDAVTLAALAKYRSTLK